MAQICVPARAQMDQFLKNIVEEPGHATGASSEGKVGSGLKEALQVATEKAVGLTGRPNGYYDNPAIKSRTKTDKAAA